VRRSVRQSAGLSEKSARETSKAPGHEDPQFPEVAEVASPRLPGHPPPRPHLRHQQDEPAVQGKARLSSGDGFVPPLKAFISPQLIFTARSRRLDYKATMRSGVMKRLAIATLLIGAVGFVAVGFASSARAQDVQKTPKSWNYVIKDGKRVPKGNRTVNADGSWREEIRQGNCVTIKEKSARGEYKETRRCD
jgi:hypothetical protein